MSKSRSLIRYKGQVYVATEVTVTPAPTGAAVVAERDYEDDVRGVYRKGESYYGVVKLKWHQFGDKDEISFPISNDTAWTMLVYIMKDGAPNRVTLNKEEVEALQLKAVSSVEYPSTHTPAGRVIDISGHYVRADAMPMYYKEYVGEVSKVVGVFCEDRFSLVNSQFRNVTPEMVHVFSDTLQKALRIKYPNAAIDIRVVKSGDPESMGCFGYVFPLGANNREVIQARKELERDVLLPIWWEIYRSHIEGTLPDHRPQPIHAHTNEPDTAAYIQQLLTHFDGKK